MRESSHDLAQLQEILDQSLEESGAHLRSIFSPESRLNASELVAEFDGVFEMHIGVLTGEGAPLVAPVDGVFYRGFVCFGFPGASLRSRLIRKDGRVSASYQNEKGGAFIVHGEAIALEEEAAFFEGYADAITHVYSELYGERWKDWYERRDKRGEYNGFIKPRSMFAKRGN